MGRSSESITKTFRLLVVFHLFRHCQEVSFKEITDMLPVSPKTAFRDIQFLKQAGVLQICYSRKRQAFVPVSLEFREPQWPENKNRKLYLEKIRRLCTIMARIEGSENPISWYREQYPGLSERTRQRDFKELGRIGYRIGYHPVYAPDRAWDPNYKPGWYYEFPAGAYDILFDGNF